MTKDISQVAIEALQELDPNMEVARYLDGHGVYTAEEMIEEIKKGSEVGSDFVTGWIRLARDFIAKNNPYAAAAKEARRDMETDRQAFIIIVLIIVSGLATLFLPLAFNSLNKYLELQKALCVQPTSQQPNPTQLR